MFNDFASRMGMLLAEGKIKCEVLVLHSISSAWLVRCDDYDWKTKIHETFNKDLMDVINCLDQNQILNHLGDEAVMEKTASVDGKTLNIFSGDLIMDTDTVGYKVKNTIYDFVNDLKQKLKDNQGIIWAVLGGIVLVFVIIMVLKAAKWISRILSVLPDKKDKNNNKRE